MCTRVNYFYFIKNYGVWFKKKKWNLFSFKQKKNIWKNINCFMSGASILKLWITAQNKIINKWKRKAKRFKYNTTCIALKSQRNFEGEFPINWASLLSLFSSNKLQIFKQKCPHSCVCEFNEMNFNSFSFHTKDYPKCNKKKY